ncbi:hypothetical protein CBR_g21794 [Chara braunii]|uniref:Uncharacterized protein n=1 Tax=Chara braunii TaxID=69332 RepID=A0A388JUG0_CHABU|nr:hypothetical protein CBR_g21794 [Chara braunii]|eukprot:GBG61449.1 hypothetical protein CBR_g21794 [Chara braunii]
MGVPHKSSVKIVELSDEGSRLEARSNEKSDDIKAWATTTLGNSLGLINEKLEEVDKKSKMSAAEREEFKLLRLEKQKAEKESRESSTEKRKRMAARTPVENSPSATRVKTGSRGSMKTRPKRIEISDDDGTARVKQNLETRMESKSELSDIKQMLAALLHGIDDPKGKSKGSVGS